MIATIILVLLGSLHQSSTLDISQANQKVTMQSEVETVLITTDLRVAFGTIAKANAQLSKISREIIDDRTITSQRGREWGLKKLKAIKGMTILLRDAELNLEEVFNSLSADNMTKGKRAIEFLGDLLSGMTGVPSASDHRKIIEELKLLKIDSEGIKDLMTRTNREQKQILSALHVHSNSFLKVAKDLENIKLQQTELSNHGFSTLKLLDIHQNVLYYVLKVNELTHRARTIMRESKNEHLSSYAIDHEDLRDIISKISAKHINIQPAFSVKQINRYYEAKLTHSWADKAEKCIYSILQIPLVNFEHQFTIAILPTLMTKHPELDLLAIDKRANTYRFLSDVEFKDCLNLGKARVCQKRPIEISPFHSCNLAAEKLTCNNWDYLVIHDLSNTEIMILSDEKQNVTLDCKGKRSQQITLPRTGIFNLNGKCRLQNENFTIGMLNYHRFTGAVSSDFEIQNLQWDSLEHFEPLKHDDLIEAINATDLRILYAFNRTVENENDIDEFKRESDKRWSIINGLGSQIERWGMWATTATSICLSMISIIFCLISRCQSATNEPKIAIVTPPVSGTTPQNTGELERMREIYAEEREELARVRRDREHAANQRAAEQRIYDRAN
jgi:hypothetical protein